MKTREETRALSPRMAISYALIALLCAFFVSVIVSDAPPSVLLFITFIFFVSLVYFHGSSFNATSNTRGETGGGEAYDQLKISAKIKELQNLRPTLKMEDLEKMSPSQKVRYLDSEINFLKTLYTEMEGYKEVISSKKDTLSEPIELESLKVNRANLVGSIKEALQAERIDILIQPIVRLPHRKPISYECFSRIREKDDSILIPDNFLHLANKDASLISILDNAVLYRCIQIIRLAWKKGADIKFFCNLSMKSLQNKKFSKNLIEFFRANPNMNRSLILEFEDIDMNDGYKGSLPILEALFDLGCVFSLDQIHDIDKLAISELSKSGFKYLKINSQTILDVVNKDKEDQRIIDLKRKADKKGIDLIITHIEKEVDLLQLLDFDFDHGQGYLFGKPQLNPF